MKDAARLLGYFAATILFGAIAAPILFWAAQWLAARGILPALAKFEFRGIFPPRAPARRAPVSLAVSLRGFESGARAISGSHPIRIGSRDMTIGFLISAVPVLCCGSFSCRVGQLHDPRQRRLDGAGGVALSAVVVPFIEEALFRGLFLGVLLRGLRPWSRPC